ncbi:hypothetical protein, conserved [Eimeria tenella]|uniref:Trichohyalin-plectin-homology domain-containing protein n=1 Tax=Eimeria tenella TaxID=5802 RepID=U6KNF1_EIMTE|nr:hypothetical protein, conserved [Eimeria tenella]CDJ36973.1 hypothetical protein, conserved [Eimeria tenella]|eukprot:XP_013227811.1 hypothetical protein, conserved [Eimeria tenella]
MAGATFRGGISPLGSFPPKCSRGVTLLHSELEQIIAVAAGLPTDVDHLKEIEMQKMKQKQKEAAARVSKWHNLLQNARERKLAEQRLQEQRREQELLAQSQEEERQRQMQEEEEIQRAKLATMQRDEKFRTFLRAQMIADTIAWLRGQQEWLNQKNDLERMRQFDLLEEQKKLEERLRQREMHDKEKQQAKLILARATLKQQIQEREKQKEQEIMKAAAEAETNKKRLQELQQAEYEAERAKREESRRLYRELVKENEELQERRRAAEMQQKAEEAAAFACAAKLRQREEAIRKRQEEVRAWALGRSERLISQGAAVIAATQAEEARRIENQCEQWMAQVRQAEEAKQHKKAASLRHLMKSSEEQIEAKRREKKQKEKEDAEYVELFRKAATIAQEKEEREHQEQRRNRLKVRHEQERQAQEKEQLRRQQRELSLAEDMKSNEKLREVDLMVERFAEDSIAAAKAAGTDWRILEMARRRLRRQSSLREPHREHKGDNSRASPRTQIF